MESSTSKIVSKLTKDDVDVAGDTPQERERAESFSNTTAAKRDEELEIIIGNDGKPVIVTPAEQRRRNSTSTQDLHKFVNILKDRRHKRAQLQKQHSAAEINQPMWKI